jgi:hypothetical protein
MKRVLLCSARVDDQRDGEQAVAHKLVAQGGRLRAGPQLLRCGHSGVQSLCRGRHDNDGVARDQSADHRAGSVNVFLFCGCDDVSSRSTPSSPIINALLRLPDRLCQR